jgi:hypothetical protein
LEHDFDALLVALFQSYVFGGNLFLRDRSEQGDQIGRIFADKAISLFKAVFLKQ